MAIVPVNHSQCTKTRMFYGQITICPYEKRNVFSVSDCPVYSMKIA